MKEETIIVGGGLAGLTCAVKLHEAGRPFRLLESSDGPGGRVRTDLVDGFRLDRGFQVYLDSYRNAGQLLDLDALDLRPFLPGALVWKEGKLREILDVFRHPFSIPRTALQPVGTIKDKWLVAQLRFHILSLSAAEIWELPNVTTETYLREFGFSPNMIDDFFRSFYGGIFLENELKTSARMFAFTFQHFTNGCATLPAGGMQAIPNQLASRLPAESLFYKTDVESISEGVVSTGAGELRAEQIVIATDGSTAAKWFPERVAPEWHSTSCFQFASDRPPVNQPIVVLKGDRDSPINNLCVPSLVAPSYAPAGKHLISVSVSDGLSDESIVRRELEQWFGGEVKDWVCLRHELIRKALPINPPGHLVGPPRNGNIFFCGDHTTSASIEGAVLSGLRVADRILRR